MRRGSRRTPGRWRPRPGPRISTLKIGSLKLTITKLQHGAYGASSERARLLDQLELQLGELVERRAQEATADEITALQSAGKKPPQQKPARRPLPAHLPRERVMHTPPTVCPCCTGTNFRKFGADETESLERIPAQWKVVVHVREKMACRTCRGASSSIANDLMSWCEDNGVQYVLGLAGNERLVAQIAPEIKAAGRTAKRTGQPIRVFADFPWRTRKSWSAERRVIGKAEWTQGAANPRFIVTNVHEAFGSARFLYETVYCARGEMEIRLKECQGDLFADRTPTPTMRANQLRLWLSSLAYVLICAVRRIGLAGTRLERATCGTIRLTLLKTGARVTISVRRVSSRSHPAVPRPTCSPQPPDGCAPEAARRDRARGSTTEDQC